MEQQVMANPLAELDLEVQRAARRPGPVIPHRAETLVAVAARAPSLHNTQPWRFRVRDDVLELRADRERQLWATDPAGRQLAVSCGAALLGLRLALRRFGHHDDVRLMPDPGDADLLAELRAGPPVVPDEQEERLLEAVALRHSHRGRFADEPVPPQLVFRLQDAAEREGCRLFVVERPGARRAVSNIVAAAERAQQSHPGVRAELEDWTPPPGSDRQDGIPASAYPVRPAPASPQELTGRDFAGGRDQGEPAELVLPVSSGAPPIVAILLSPADAPGDWLAAGQALYRVLLTAAAEGAQASLHGQPTELDGLRRLLQDELIVSEQPQMLLQIGRPPVRSGVATPTPRRPVEDLLDR